MRKEFSDASAVTASNKISEIAARIERLPLTSWQVKARLIIGVATFFDAFDVLAIGYALPAIIKAWSIKPQNVGVIISAGFAGQLVGAFFFGWLAERIGRLRVMIATILVYAIFSFCCAASWSFHSLVIFRIIQGFGLGGEVPVAASYINEITRAKGRGRFVLLYELVFSIGLMAAALFGYLIVPHFGWRWLLIIGGVPAAVAIYLRWGLPESPRWLAGVGRGEEAEQAMAVIEERVREASGGELPEPAAVRVAGEVKRTRFSELFSGIYLKRTILVWVIWFSAYLTTYGMVTWLPSIYTTVFKMPLDKALLYGLTTQAVGFVGSFLAAAVLIDKIGRRGLITIAFFGSAAAQFVLWYTGTTTALQVLVLASAAFFFIGPISLAVYVYTPELYPTRMRALGSSVASAWLRLASIIGPIMVGTVIAHYHRAAWAFLFFGLVAFAAGLVTLIFGIETKGQVLEKISP